MGFKTASIALFLLASIVSAAPQGSKHNVYLVRCDPEDCPIGLCDPGEFTITAATYFSTGAAPTSGRTAAKPDGIGKLSGYNPSFESATSKNVRVGRAGTFTWSITTAAKTLTKGEIAGTATLGTEPFACFKDGTTKFTITDDLDRYSCTADYWCGSTDVGSGTPATPPAEEDFS
jgi:hypothetical protein